MNEVIQAMVQRRSCRKYQKKEVPAELLDQVLLAGTYAASGMGRQSGKIVALTNPEDVAYLEKLNNAVMGKEGHPFYGAPVVLVVLADSDVPTWQEDGSLVMGNLMLAAHSVGLASCWIHRARQEFDSPEGKELLKKWGIPESYRGIGHCILGYAEGDLPAAKERKADFIVKP